MNPSAPRRALQLTGVLVFLIGAAAVIVPAAASVTITLLIGWLLAAAGLVALTGAVFHARDHRVVRAVWGLCAVAAGLYLVILPGDGVETLTIVLAANLILLGLIRLVGWGKSRGRPGAAAMGLNGFLGLLVGVLIALELPGSAAWAFGLLVGIDLMFFGIALISLGRTIDHTAPVGARVA